MNMCNFCRGGRPVLTMIGFALWAGVTFSAVPASATYERCPGASLVQSAAKSFVAASQTHDPAAFAAAISHYTNVDGLALFALGPFRSALPPGRKPEYFAKTRAFMGRFFADHATRFANAKLQIESCADGQIRSVVGGQTLVWRVSGNRVSDVELEGVWLVTELRSKFVSIIRNGHGDIGSLFEFLDRNS